MEKPAKQKRQIEIEYIKGDVVAEDQHTKLMVTGKGIMIADDEGNQHYSSWGTFLPRLKHLMALEKLAHNIHWEVDKELEGK